MRSWNLTGAAPTQQPQELESGEVDDGIYGIAEQARRCKRGVHEADPVFLFHIRQGQPQMPLRRPMEGRAGAFKDDAVPGDR